MPPDSRSDPRSDLRIAALRAEVDDLDERIVAALHRRAGLVRAIALRKRELGLAALDPAREHEMAAMLAVPVRDGVPAHDMRRILAFAMRTFRRIASSPGPEAPQ
ncbi:MAG: chorismate mutase [Planctomycetes bacterium]|nr:chorismate mutase [Planctomycetota bacterium]